jgi:hypothetical protein
VVEHSFAKGNIKGSSPAALFEENNNFVSFGRNEAFWLNTSLLMLRFGVGIQPLFDMYRMCYRKKCLIWTINGSSVVEYSIITDAKIDSSNLANDQRCKGKNNICKQW